MCWENECKRCKRIFIEWSSQCNVCFSLADLLKLQDAAHEWGSARYNSAGPHAVHCKCIHRWSCAVYGTFDASIAIRATFTILLQNAIDFAHTELPLVYHDRICCDWCIEVSLHLHWINEHSASQSILARLWSLRLSRLARFACILRIRLFYCCIKSNVIQWQYVAKKTLIQKLLYGCFHRMLLKRCASPPALVGAVDPSKIMKVTLMRPFHGNL